MTNTNHHELIIIGCGAAGMMAAISAAVYCKDILILEQKPLAGKKLPATGNGKCNFTNLDMKPEYFRSTNPDLIWDIYRQFDNEAVISFFDGLGIPCRTRNGYCYPYSSQASSIRDALIYKCQALACEIIYDIRVSSLERKSDKYIINKTYSCDKLILAGGGASSPVFGSDGSCLKLLEGLGLKTYPFRPALVGLKSKDSFLKTVAGVRTEALVSLYVGSQLAMQEYGEIIFNKDNISGIPVMNMSRYAVEGGASYIDLDLFPDYTEDQLYSRLLNRLTSTKLTIEQALTGFHNNKLIYMLLGKTDLPCDGIFKQDKMANKLAKLVKLLKGLRINITETNGFENSQVSAGGLALSEIDPKTLELIKYPNIYCVGELLDVDAICGGYNLQWAWTTGAIAGAYAGGGRFDKDKLIKNTH